MDGGAWWATVHGLTKSQTQLRDFTSFLSFLFYYIYNNSRKDEEMESEHKQCPVVDVTGDGSKSDAIKSNIA